MNPVVPPFKNRTHAGRLLARALKDYAGAENVLVLGLPRGGVPVAYEVAVSLELPLDVLIVRKLGFPDHPEFAMGAIASGGGQILNDDLIRRARLSPDTIRGVIERETHELHRREIAYRGRTGLSSISGKTVILIDDGIATGSTMKAALQMLRAQNPASIIVAVPTCSQDAANELRSECDRFIALVIPRNFEAVGQWYHDFGQTSDANVNSLLSEAALHKLRSLPLPELAESPLN